MYWRFIEVYFVATLDFVQMEEFFFFDHTNCNKPTLWKLKICFYRNKALVT